MPFIKDIRGVVLLRFWLMGKCGELVICTLLYPDGWYLNIVHAGGVGSIFGPSCIDV